MRLGWKAGLHSFVAWRRHLIVKTYSADRAIALRSNHHWRHAVGRSLNYLYGSTNSQPRCSLLLFGQGVGNTDGFQQSLERSWAAILWLTFRNHARLSQTFFPSLSLAGVEKRCDKFFAMCFGTLSQTPSSRTFNFMSAPAPRNPLAPNHKIHDLSEVFHLMLSFSHACQQEANNSLSGDPT